MKHLNGNLLCAVDTETTGLDPRINEIFQIAIIPLASNLEVSDEYPVFELKLKPESPDTIDPDATKMSKGKLNHALMHGLDQVAAADALITWFESLNLPPKKNLMPLAHNWAFDLAFIRSWLGPETTSYIFNGLYRDTMAAALYLNDVADFHNVNWPFPKYGLQYVASQLGIFKDQYALHDAMGDAMLTARVYKKMMNKVLGIV